MTAPVAHLTAAAVPVQVGQPPLPVDIPVRPVVEIMGHCGSLVWEQHLAAAIAAAVSAPVIELDDGVEAALVAADAKDDDDTSVSAFWKDRYEKDKAKNWNLFYRRNKDHFYKDRHYLLTVFPELRGPPVAAGQQPGPQTMLEAGCGTGASVWPILDENPHMFAFATDLAESAISIMRSSPGYDPARVNGFVSDYSAEGADSLLRDRLGGQALDCVLLMFSLSAVAPEFHRRSLASLVAQLRPGGALLFRDYAKGDLAQQRFDKDRKTKRIDKDFYVRQDGTRSFFFTARGLEALMASVGLRCVELRYVERVVENHQRQIAMDRRWLHGRFVKMDGKESAAARAEAAAVAAVAAPAAPAAPEGGGGGGKE